jgi:hypothetical protein
MERKRINFSVNTLGHSHEIIDALYGYYQAQDPDNQSWIDFVFSQDHDPMADLNIYLDYMPNEDRDLSHYDAVIYSNGCEPLTVATKVIHDRLEANNVFLACNSYLSPTHPMADRVLWLPANVLICRDLWCRYFTLSFYENHAMKSSVTRDKGLLLINGRLDSWRHHFATKIKNICPDIEQRSTISTVIHETNDSFFESPEDLTFRETVNTLYENLIVRNASTTYYDNSVSLGIEGKFGIWPPGYFILPEYYAYRCVIFPESTWQNDEVAVTEKILKCFYAGCFPWPVGGCNINRMYNELGFRTAWNLLPDHLKIFDAEKDHMRRYDLMVDAMAWLSTNQHVMVEPQAQEMLQSNLINFLTCAPGISSIQKFDRIIRKLLEHK